MHNLLIPLEIFSKRAEYWINETDSRQTDSGTWVATIKFEGENGMGITSTITSDAQ